MLRTIAFYQNEMLDLKTWLNNDLLYSEGESQLLQLWVLGD